MPLLRGRSSRRLFTLVKPYFQSSARWQGLGLLAVLLVLYLAVSGLNAVNSFVGCNFSTSIEQRNFDGFVYFALVYVGVFLASTVVAVFCRFAEETLGLRWREWLTRHMVDKYLARHAYYRMNGRPDIDNPDQRIAEDVKTFTVTALSFLLIAVNSTIALCTFSGILWSITPWLFVGAAGYAAFGSLTTIFLGRRLIGLNMLQLKKEADLRYELIQVRTNAEPVALTRGEEGAKRRIGGRLDRVVENFRGIISLNRNIGFFTNGYNYFIQLIPALIVAPLYIRGEVEFGKVTQAAMAFATVMNAFSLIVEEFQRISSFGAVIERVGAAWEAIEEESLGERKAGLELVEDRSQLAFERVTLVTPRDDRLLIQDLTVRVPCGQRLLILGPHGSGRTALLRAVAGLWSKGQGRIHRPPLDEVMFLPQQPYLRAGILREQLLPGGAEVPDDRRVRAVLREAGFEAGLKRVGGLDAEGDWPALLSLGEQQQLAFARLLLAGPRLAFLDEATSALEADQGQALYEALARRPISYVSVGADPRLADFHDLVLELHGNGAWGMAVREQPVSA